LIHAFEKEELPARRRRLSIELPEAVLPRLDSVLSMAIWSGSGKRQRPPSFWSNDRSPIPKHLPEEAVKQRRLNKLGGL